MVGLLIMSNAFARWANAMKSDLPCSLDISWSCCGAVKRQALNPQLSLRSGRSASFCSCFKTHAHRCP